MSAAVATNAGKVVRSSIDRQRVEFLRSCRARICPADWGLSPVQRKRTNGLRREDVAVLAGVSVSWYTWLEQGRDMRVSDEMLERLCRVFRLTENERIYLFSLVQHRPPRVNCDVQQEAAPDIVRMIKSLATPAVAMNLRWDVLAWNRLSAAIFRDYAAMKASERNLIEILFTRLTYKMSPLAFENMARRVLAKLRVDYSNSAPDPRFEALIRRLDAISPLFHRMWRSPEINVGSYGIHRFIHPRYGELAFEHTSYVPDGHPHTRVVICAPDDEATAQAIAQANAEVAKVAFRPSE
jgi:transcriptional regulator with XRE-family HTH domain